MLRSYFPIGLTCVLVACTAAHTVREPGDAGAADTGTRSAGERDAASRADAASLSDGSTDAEASDASRTSATTITDHHIVRRDCDSTPYVDWSVVISPTACMEALTCGTECLDASDCSDSPFGRCVGGGASRCEYGPQGQSAGGLCTGDFECTLTAGGHCGQSPVPGFRQCEYPDKRFNVYESCERDRDCTLAKDAHCVRELKFASCHYDGCRVDADCGADAACICEYGDHTCVPAECRSDADCEAGHGCHPSQRFTEHTSGLYCTTDADTCSDPSEFCPEEPSKVCAFDTEVGHWACLSSNLVTLPRAL